MRAVSPWAVPASATRSEEAKTKVAEWWTRSPSQTDGSGWFLSTPMLRTESHYLNVGVAGSAPQTKKAVWWCGDAHWFIRTYKKHCTVVTAAVALH